MLPGHNIATARSMGWEKLSNGSLLRAAEDEGFTLILTTDQRIKYQQNLSGRTISIVVLTGTTKWTQVRLIAAAIGAVVSASYPGSYAEVFIPYAKRKSQ